MTRTIIAVCSDFQCGSSQGLLDPDTQIEEIDEFGNPYFDENGQQVYAPVRLNPVQRYLFPIYTDAIENTFKLAGTDDIHLLVNGDMCQGDKYHEDLTFGREADQTQGAATLIARWLKNDQVKTVRLTKSTRAHSFSEDSADSGVTRKLKDWFPTKNIRLVRHGVAEIGGVLVDYAHHGPPGGVRSWLKGNLMRYYVKSLIDNCIKDSRPIPQVVLRAHKHERVEEWVIDWRMDDRIKTVGVTTPSFQMLNAFAQKVTNSEQRVTHGMVALEIEDARIKDVHWFAKTRYIPAQESL